MTTSTEPRLQHLACIMDGNRRWAQQKGMIPFHNDRAPLDAVYTTIAFCQTHAIPHLSLFALSAENRNLRDAALLNRLFSLLHQVCTTERHQFVDHNIRVRFIGDRSLFPTEQLAAMTALEVDTQNATGLQLNILFCYGGQQEIVAACSLIAQKVADGLLPADAITVETMKQHLWMHHAPLPDLIIRTGGVSRLSNFLLFEAAYAELMFLDCLWPDITTEILESCRENFKKITRNFGK